MADFPIQQDFFIDALQWPAMVATLIAAYCVGAQTKVMRRWGFVSFIISNILWIIWGAHTGAYALIFLQVGLFFLNIRGINKNTQGHSGGHQLEAGKQNYEGRDSIASQDKPRQE